MLNNKVLKLSRMSKIASSNLVGTVEKKKTTAQSFTKFLTSSPAQIWKSKISWRIASAVFLTILTVQAGILNITLKDFENTQLNHLQQIAHAAISPSIDKTVTNRLISPLSDESAANLISTTIIKGIAIYTSLNVDLELINMYEGTTRLNLNIIKTFGQPTTLSFPTISSLTNTYYSQDGTSYEVAFRSHNYIVAVNLDSSKVQGKVFNYVIQTIIIMLLMSAFVTTVLMIALGRWLLEPILFMRNNLISASKDPENPNIQASPFDPSDEIGSAINIAQTLILQNAENIRHIKSTAEDKIHKLAYYDALTNLPNRTLFLQTLSENMRTSGDEDIGRFAVITIDLDHFKDINDSMGHNVGDAILRSVGKRLRSSMPGSATVSRTGEDEFAITMPLNTDINHARDVAERIINVIRAEPFKVFNEQFQVRASVGVATFPDDGIDPDVVLKNADIALNRAKEEGRDRIKEYSENFDYAVQQRFQMLRDLRDAMEQGQLSLSYQPQLDLNTGKIIGAEALLRWWKPDNSKDGGSFISPVEFIPVAEQSGLIVPIGEWVMETAAKAAVEWRDEHGLDIRIAINVSPAQFNQGNIVEFVEKTVIATGLDAHKMELEVTESVFMDDIERTIQTLKDLHALGVELAIDDFGTGYSSLSYLRLFPIDRLKIDQSFIRNALNNADDAAIARTIVSLGHSLNLKVIAEGVETKDHEEFLLAQNCDEVQGYRYSRPVPNEEFIEFAKNYNGSLDSFNK